MIEVYVNTSETLELKLYEGGQRVNSTGPVTITVTDRETGDAITTGGATDTTTDETTKEVYSYLLTMSETSQPRKLKVVWSFEISGETGQKVDSVEVVVPYTTPDEILSAHSSLSAKTFDELKEMERRVRHIIDNYCNQSFDYKDNKTMQIIASGGDILVVPERIRTLTSVKRGEFVLYSGASDDLVEFYDDNPYMITKKDRWINVGPYSDRKRDISAMFSPGRNMFETGAVYEVVGDFGWDYVPNEVNLAATLLVGEYFCGDSSYRRKNVWWAKTDQFELRFNKDLLYTTGNVDVDLLLMDYVANSVVMF